MSEGNVWAGWGCGRELTKEWLSFRETVSVYFVTTIDGFDYKENDFISTFQETHIGFEGMKVDRMFFQQFEDTVKQDADILKAIDAGNIESAMGLTLDKYLNKPSEFFTVDKLRKALKIDRKVSLREIL